MQPQLRDLPELPPGAAVWRGTLTALVVALPAALLNQFVLDEPPIAQLLWLLILFGAAAGGWAVVRLSPTARLPHAAAAGALAYLIVQALGTLRRLGAGEPISWIAYPFLAAFMAVVAMLGGMYARRTTRRYAPDE